MQENDNVLDPNVLPGPKGYCFRFFHCPWRLEEGTTFDLNLPFQPAGSRSWRKLRILLSSFCC